jgi:hypothetical protein
MKPHAPATPPPARFSKMPHRRWRPTHRGELARTSYIGGVFRSDILRERFAMLVQLESDAPVYPPAMGPAAGALIEAYRLAGLHVQPSNAPPGV